MWTGLFFIWTTLCNHGLQVQLSHSCPTKLATNMAFRAIHSNGIHHIAVDQCHCQGVPLYKQLLQIGWWPATPLDPKTVVTFKVLWDFHLLNLQGKVTRYSFYWALEFQTDHTGLMPSPILLYFHCHFQFADYNMHRTSWDLSCQLSGSGVIQKCWSVLAKLLIQEVSGSPPLVLWQYPVAYVPSWTLIFHEVGKMWHQSECVYQISIMMMPLIDIYS